MKKLLLWVAVALTSLALGVGATLLVDQGYWRGQLSVQLAEKDRLIEGLNQNINELKSGLDSLQKNNVAQRALIEASLKESAEVARSNKTSLEKLRAVILRLEQLQAALKTSP